MDFEKYLNNYELSQSLLNDLIYFSKYNNRLITKELLIDSFALKKGKNIPDLFEKNKEELVFSSISQKAGFKSIIKQKKVSDLDNIFLPAIIILNNNSSCILESINENTNKATIKTFEHNYQEEIIDFDNLNKIYDGSIIILKKEYKEKEISTNLLKKVNTHWFWTIIKNNANIYKDILIASIIINVFVLFSPFYIMNIYDRVVPNFAEETLWALSIGIFVIFIFDFILKTIRGYYIDIVSKKIDIIVSTSLMDKILNLKLTHKPKYIGAFANNIKDFTILKNFVSSSTINVLVDLPFSILFLVAILYISGSIVLIPILFIFLIICYSLIIKRPLHDSIELTNESIAHKNGLLIETLSAMETIKGLGESGKIRWEWQESTSDIANKSLLTNILSSSIVNMNAFFIQTSTIAVVVYGVYSVHENILTLGGLIAAVILSSRAIAPMGQFASLISNYEQARASYKLLDNIMNLPEEQRNDDSLINKKELKGNIEFKNVSFSYDENRKILDNVNFSIKKGEKVAILGKIGSGKSTILKLLMKLYDSTEGQISIDGIEIKQFEPVVVRKNFAYVSQDAILFDGSLKDNILYKYPHKEDEAVLKAMETSQLMDFVNSHPMGFNMRVGERGDNLSGGQKKSLSLARAIVGDYSTLLLDEPTESMDSTTEHRLIESLKDEVKDKTLVLITHKSSMLKLVDRVIIVENGKIIVDDKKDIVLNKLLGNTNESR